MQLAARRATMREWPREDNLINKEDNFINKKVKEDP